MAPIHKRLQAALERRQKAERAHLAATVAQSGLAATAANLAAAAASLTKMPPTQSIPGTPKGPTP